MALNVSYTADCNKIIISVTNAPSGQNTIQITNGTNSATYDFTEESSTRVVTAAEIGGGNGIYVVNHVVDGSIFARAAVLLSCDILCCLASKMNELLKCDCDCTKCADQLAEAQKIFLLLKTAESELALADEAGTIQQIQAVIDSAQEKYLTAQDMCAGHCGCNC
jgi:hypothetical protein